MELKYVKKFPPKKIIAFIFYLNSLDNQKILFPFLRWFLEIIYKKINTIHHKIFKLSKNITLVKYNIKYGKKKCSVQNNIGKDHTKFQLSKSKNVEVMNIYPR